MTTQTHQPIVRAMRADRATHLSSYRDFHRGMVSLIVNGVFRDMSKETRRAVLITLPAARTSTRKLPR